MGNTAINVYKKDADWGAAFETTSIQKIQHGKEQEGIGDVQEQVGQVVAPRLAAVQLGVQQQRQPCQRMPVGRPRGGPGPGEVLCGEAGEKMRILGNVGVVVVVDKATVPDRAERHQGPKRERGGQEPRAAPPPAGARDGRWPGEREGMGG